MLGNDWSHFKITANFNAGVHDIYKAWTTKAGLESWFLRSAEFFTSYGKPKDADSSFQSGDSYKWLWHGFPDDVFEKGKILEANEKDILTFTFTGGCIVSITLSDKKDFTLLELTQKNISLENNPEKNLYVQCKTGWVFYLANLKSIIEGGIDLRNKRMDLKSDFK